MSDSVQPHRRQPIRLPRPWDSPGKNTGVGCHFLLPCMKVKSESAVAQSCPILAIPWTAAHQAPPSMGFSRQKYWSGVPLVSYDPFYFCVVCCDFSIIISNFVDLILPLSLFFLISLTNGLSILSSQSPRF